MPGTRITLDHPALAGRTRIYQSRRSTYERRSVVPGRSQLMSDVRPAAKPQPTKSNLSQSKGVVHPVAKAAPARIRRSKVLKRQGLAAPLMQKTKAPSRRRRGSMRNVALTAFAVLLFVIGLGVGGLQFLTNHKVKAQVAALTTHKAANAETSSTDADPSVPAEDRPASISDYHVAARLPRVLRIQKIGVESRVVQVGVNSNNQLRAPASIFDAGWYNGSALPGDNGAVLLDGHVHGPTKPGVFNSLKNLKAGDKLTLEQGDGKVLTYHVVKSQSYAKDAVDMGAAFSSITPGKPGLNLITCDGSYNDAGEYNNRLIVFAVQD